MSERLTDEELQEMRERAETATAGELITDKIGDRYVVKRDFGEGRFTTPARFHYQGDAELFCHARTDIPRLLDEVERLHRQINLIDSRRGDQQIIIRHVAAERDRYREVLEAVYSEARQEGVDPGERLFEIEETCRILMEPDQ